MKREKKWKYKMGGVKRNLQLHMLDPSVDDSIIMSYYTHFIHTIYLLKWFENNYFPMMLWPEPNGEVHCKLFTMKN